jgi:hypothetical protein
MTLSSQHGSDFAAAGTSMRRCLSGAAKNAAGHTRPLRLPYPPDLTDVVGLGISGRGGLGSSSSCAPGRRQGPLPGYLGARCHDQPTYHPRARNSGASPGEVANQRRAAHDAAAVRSLPESPPSSAARKSDRCAGGGRRKDAGPSPRQLGTVRGRHSTGARRLGHPFSHANCFRSAFASTEPCRPDDP